MPNYPRGKKGRVYNQGEYDMAMNTVSLPQARKKMAGHHGMSQKVYKNFMASYKPSGPLSKKPRSGGGGGKNTGAKIPRAPTRKKKLSY